MVLGALFLINSPLTGGGVSLSAALGVAIPCAVIIIILMRLVLRSRSWKMSTGKEELIGEVGEVTEPVDPPACQAWCLFMANFGAPHTSGRRNSQGRACAGEENCRANAGS